MFPHIGSIRGPGPAENETLVTRSAADKYAILETLGQQSGWSL
jgi:hypothetical protein